MSTNEVTPLLQQFLLGEAGDHADVPMVVFDDDRNFLAANVAYCRFTGYSREELLQLRAGHSLAADDGTRADFTEKVSVQRQPTLSGIGRLRRKDGEVVEVAWLTIRTEVSFLPYFIGMLWPTEEAPFDLKAYAVELSSALREEARTRGQRPPRDVGADEQAPPSDREPG